MLSAHFITSINQVSSKEWNQICGIDYPFLRHEFFSAMENSGSTTKETGWEPHHLLIKEEANIVAIVPLFIKTHSYGEYVFDWSWAEAYHRHGIEYYPKLINATPFTPATGPRWAIEPSADPIKTMQFISGAIRDKAHTINASSCHCLFTSQPLSLQLKKQGWLQRTGYQYHWFNEDHSDFNDFLQSMNSRKRKSIIKERKKIIEQNISLITKQGSEITAKDWKDFYVFYQTTYLKRSRQQGYLSASFFPLLAEGMAENIIMTLAFHDNEEDPVAAALCFKDSTTLYGRYWGCKESFDSLHFEACYYQGIDYAIQHQLKRFDSGAQGEHKIQRGFTPIETYSNHWIAHEEFHQAIKKFVDVEEIEIKQYIEEAKQSLPFKNPNQ